MATIMYYNENNQLVDVQRNMPVELAKMILAKREDVKVFVDGEEITK